YVRSLPSNNSGRGASSKRAKIYCSVLYAVVSDGGICNVKWNHGAQPTGRSKFPAPRRPALPFDRCKRLLRPRDRHRAASPACSGGGPVSGEDATLRNGLREPFPPASTAVS